MKSHTRIIVGDDDSYDDINKGFWKIWRNSNGKRHRDGDLPAVIMDDGSMVYYKNGKRHRDGDLPAVIYTDVSVEYYRDDKLHRDDGFPAVVWANGSMGYWVDGVRQNDNNQWR